jgi:hypothetical protein
LGPKGRNRIIPPLRELPASQVARVIDETQGAGTFRVRVGTQDIAGDDVSKVQSDSLDVVRIRSGTSATGMEQRPRAPRRPRLRRRLH